MNIHEISPKTPRQSKKIVGRGGTRGKTAGRGTKGQNARAGHKKRPELRDVIKKLPKLRGYKFNPINESPYAINLSDLERVYEAGETVSVESMIAY
jgi:large subunit ribosomal protein L15